MAKKHSRFVCQQCGYSQTGWAGKCPECDSWGSLVETVVERQSGGKSSRATKVSKKTTVNLSKVTTKSTKRKKTKITELDRVLGGGLVNGQVILLAGEPGIGKSTLLLQAGDSITGKDILYASGEESAHQIKIRGDRLDIKSKNIHILEETDIDEVLATAKEKLTKSKGVLVIDSIQTMTTEDLSGMAGSVGQVRECAYRIVKYAKQNNIPTFVVGHVTKSGNIAGPAVLMHIVDSVLWFEGEKEKTLRLLRAVKNRFGATDEVGVFEMKEKGLISLTNPEKLFLSKDAKIPGNITASVMQGSRPMLVEIQSLINRTNMAYPKRVAQGIDSRRLELIIAVLIKHCGLPLYDHDVFVNVAGGISVKEPSVDLAICLSISSSFFDKSLPKGSVAIGEVGLLGEVRQVFAQNKRIKEARRLGYKNIISDKQFSYVREVVNKHFRKGTSRKSSKK